MKPVKELYYRLRLETPGYFKKMRRFCYACVVTGVFLQNYGVDFQLFGLSAVTLLIGAGAAGVFGNSLFVEDYQALKKRVDPSAE
jgi:hypothetical protein